MSQRTVIQRQRIGPAIRKLRRMNDLTLDDLATQAGISASHLSRLERGQTLPSFTVLAQIAHVLGVSVDEFVQLELDVTALDAEFGDSLQQLGFSDEAKRELLAGSIELRRALMNTIRALSVATTTNRQAQDATLRAVNEHGLVAASAALNRVIKTTGFSGVSFTRGLVWTLDTPGEQRYLIAVPGLIGHLGGDIVGTYQALTNSEPLDPQVGAAWSAGVTPSLDITKRMIIQRDVLSKFLKSGTWLRGGPESDEDELRTAVQRLIDDVSSGEIVLAVTDEPLGEVNMLIQSEGDVVVESTRHRATEADKAHLGIILRGRSASEAFSTRFDALWNSLPQQDRSTDAVIGWIEKTSGVVRSNQ
jgi:transcriptional regulator with XRE-family HTH domain